jgi:hypothetical protein
MAIQAVLKGICDIDNLPFSVMWNLSLGAMTCFPAVVIALRFLDFL